MNQVTDSVAFCKLGDRGDEVRGIQKKLVSSGHAIVIDGDFGKMTQIAVKRFQAAHGLTPDGIVGPRTAAALLGVPRWIEAPGPTQESIKDAAPHLAVMRALTGTTEIPGARSNPLIIGWRDTIIEKYPDLKGDLSWYVNDDTPWCGLAAGIAVTEAGIKPPRGLLGARNWTGWGVEIDPGIPGAVLIFTRKGGNHIAFSEGVDAAAYHIRGGNQSNCINVRRKLKGDLIASRWPESLPLPAYGPKILTPDAEISINEA